jgi:molybdopterin/thiamine biosynthesis adenylyltransferase
MSPILAEPRHAFREIQLEPGETPDRVLSTRVRMPRFFSLAESVDPVVVLARLRVACVGVGAVGRNACLHLARLGVGALYICDRGFYKPESRLTQPIDPDEVGRPKAETVARLARRLSPATTVYVYDGPFESLGTTALADADIVLLATDNIRAEMHCGQRCLHLGKPLVQASVHGGTLTAQVRFYANTSAAGPCPACGLTREERASLTGEVVYSCDGTVAHTAENPTTSTSHLCALAGDLAVNQILRYALRLGASVVDQEIEWNGFTLASRVTPLKRKPDCPADHVVWTTRHGDRPVGDCTLRQVAHLAGMHQDGVLERATFRVGESSYVQRGVCPAGHGQAVERFVEPGETVGTCTICGEPLRREPFFTHDRAPGRLLVTQLDRPIRELCATRPQWVLVSENGTAALVRNGPTNASHRRTAE